ncbi:MAG: hypothetical protein H0X71_09060 [Rubrobacter sp.]|nr:hypothetical protein [Rubrobacter sp.]
MAYALLAGLPPVVRLYASTVPALMALPTFAGVSALAEPNSDEYVSLALLLAPVVSVPQLALSLLNTDCQSVNSINLTTTKDLEDLVSGDRSQDIHILFAHVKRRVRKPLRRTGWDEKYEGVASYPATRDAPRALGLLEEPYSSHHNLKRGRSNSGAVASAVVTCRLKF